MMHLPAWLATGDTGPLPAAKRRWGRADYLEKTLTDIQQVIAEDMYQASVSARSGFLQLLEPRVKTAGVAALLVAVAVTVSLPALAMGHILFLGIALTSGISPRAYLARSWLPAFVFAGIAVMPATLNWVTPGESLFSLYRGLGGQFGPLVMPADLYITRQGVTAAATVFLRAAASLGLVTLLVKTTRWPVLTRALQSLGVPGIFIMVLDLTYRYLFLFLLLLTDYLLGRRSRLVGTESTAMKLEWIGGTLAGFLRLAGEYSKEIAAAMQARGYGGENRQVLPGRFGWRETVFLAGVIIIGIGLWGGAWLGCILGL